MEYSERNLIDNDFPWPDLSQDTRFSGPNGVELWFAAVIPHLVRCERVKNGIATAENANAATSKNWAVRPASTEYNSSNASLGVAIQHSLYWTTDFAGAVPVAIPPDPPPTPILTDIQPRTAEIGQEFTLTGTRLAGILACDIEDGPAGTITSKTDTELKFTFAAAGNGTPRFRYGVNLWQWAGFNIEVTEPQGQN